MMATASSFVIPYKHRNPVKQPQDSSLQLFPSSQLLSKEFIDTSTNLLEAYGTVLRNHPLTTKSVTAAILSCTGDAIAQFRSKGDDYTFQYDAKRGATFLAFGALYTGAFQHIWFNYLSQHIAGWGDAIGIWGPERAPLEVDAVFDLNEWWSYFDIVAQLQHPPSDAAIAAGKVAVNQFVTVPFVYMPLFFAITGSLGGLDFNQAKARMQSLYFPLLQRNYFFWLPTQFVQFFVVPLEWQIPFLSLASLVWTVLLSSIGASSAQTASPSQIVAYETVANEDGAASDEELVMIVRVDAGPVNAVEDEVRLEDVRDSLVPEAVTEAVKGVLSDAKVEAGASAAIMGLLASAADKAAIGDAVANLVNTEVGVGVAVVTAGVGLLAAAMTDDNSNSTLAESIDAEALSPSPPKEFYNNGRSEGTGRDYSESSSQFDLTS
jgi:hypothetical protein